MTCPDCGYMMTAFEKDCPRCEKSRQAQRSCPKCGTAYASSRRECPKCHHGNGQPVRDAQPEPAKSAPAAQALGVPFAQSAPQVPVSSDSSSHTSSSGAQVFGDGSGGRQSSVLPADYLTCRVCGNSGVQKVSAICQSGTWSGQSQGQTFGMAYSPNGPIPVTGQTTASSSGATTLAQLLMPPRRPSYFEDGCVPALGAVMGTAGLVFAVLTLILGGTNAAAVVIWLLVFGCGVAIYLSSTSKAWKEKRRVAEQVPYWEKAMLVWNRLFYCPRCAHVFDPADGTFGTVHQMHQLIQPKAAALSTASDA